MQKIRGHRWIKWERCLWNKSISNPSFSEIIEFDLFSRHNVVDLLLSLHFQWRAWGQENWLFAECRYRVFFPFFFAKQFHTLGQTSFIRLSFVAIINNDWKHVCWQGTKHVAGVLASQTRHRMNDVILSKLRIVINLLRGINWKNLLLSFSNCFQEIRFSSRNLLVMFSMNLAPVLHLSSSQVEVTRFCGIKWILIQLQQRMENELEVRMEIFLQTMETTREYKSFGGILKYHNLFFFYPSIDFIQLWDMTSSTKLIGKAWRKYVE